MKSTPTLEQAQQEVVDEFALFADWQDRYEQIIEMGKDLPLIAADLKTDDNLVRGCQSRVWLHARLVPDPDGGPAVMQLAADSDALITKGLVALVVRVLNNRTPEEVLQAKLDFIDRIGLREHLSPTRSNGLASMLDQMRRYALAFSR